MTTPILKITDGDTSVDLLSLRGWSLRDWEPAVPEPKGGGVFRSSPLVDGRKLAYRKVENITDTFDLVGNGSDQNALIQSIQKLQRLLEKALSYWTSAWQNEPVWIEAKSACETEKRHAVIVDYRLTGFGSPYKQPFFNSSNNTATEAILVIEHTIWQETVPGEDGECVEVSSVYYSPEIGTYANGTFYPGESASDGTFNPTSTLLPDLTDVNIGVGYQNVLGGNCSAGIVFDNVTIPAYARIARAILTLTAGVISVGTATLIVRGQKPTATLDAEVFDGTNEDFLERTRTSAHQIIDLDDGEYPGAIDITSIVREITGTPIGFTDPSDPTPVSYWTSGDNLGIFISLYSGSGGREFCAFDNASDYAELYIEYSDTGADLGQEATCEQEVVVANKHNKAIISHVFIYDADGVEIPGNWSTNLMESPAYPYDLLPDPPEVGDRIYFISDTANVDSGPFCNIVFDILTAQTKITAGTWYYYKGAPTSDFTAFDVSGTASNELCGNAQLFLREGVCSVVFEQPAYWDTTTVNGITGWVVMFQVTAVNPNPTPPEQQNRPIYTAVLPYIDIDSAQVTGDITALARIFFDSAACWQRSMNTLVVGLRTLSRGEDFTAFLNASDEQNPDGIEFYIPQGSVAALIDTPTSPSGRMLDLSACTEETSFDNLCYWMMAGDLAKQYIGTFHAYVRVKQSVGNVGELKFRLRAVFGDEFNVSYSEINSVSLKNYVTCIDLGQLTITPPFSIRPNDLISAVRVYLDAVSDDATDYGSAYVYDLILMPSDEWIGTFGMPKITGTSVLTYGDGLDIDAITNPRQYRATQISHDLQVGSPNEGFMDTVRAEWSKIASSEPILQSNVSQRLWFLQYKYQAGLVSYFENCGVIKAERSSRFILMRGNE